MLCVTQITIATASVVVLVVVVWLGDRSRILTLESTTCIVHSHALDLLSQVPTTSVGYLVSCGIWVALLAGVELGVDIVCRYAYFCFHCRLLTAVVALTVTGFSPPQARRSPVTVDSLVLLLTAFQTLSSVIRCESLGMCHQHIAGQ